MGGLTYMVVNIQTLSQGFIFSYSYSGSQLQYIQIYCERGQDNKIKVAMNDAITFPAA